ncbi:RnfABCDGE type electron transport complex subunit D [Candidatus Woesearchaeota archaeon]|nr:RnfABCDGE type electron transport complex subunit D [Candidatus Woesearchaeota archaeon]
MDIKALFSKFTVYQYMVSFLIILSLTSAFFYGFGVGALLPILTAVLTTTIFDLVISYFKFKTWEFPQSALISGLFIGGLLTQGLQWYIYAIAGAIAILSKHLIKVKGRHIFNPANLGILLVSVIFGASHTWWVSSPIILVLIFGIFILWRLRRFDLGLSFVAAYFILVLLINISNPVTCGMMNMRCPMQPSPLADFYYTIINGGVIYFFAMYMLVEPKTHPRNNRIYYGILVAVLLVAAEKIIPQHSIPLALAIGNIFVPFFDKLKLEFKRKEAVNA